MNILGSLRSLMKNCAYVTEPIQAYIIPSSDRHQNEYLRECDKRRDFISGFTGSAGTALVTEQHACLWTDGRYYLQASQEMDENWTLMKEGLPSTPTQEAWLRKTLPAGSRVGVDPWLISNATWKQLKAGLEADGLSLVSIAINLVDIVWQNRPCSINNPIIPLHFKYTGKTCHDKVEEVRKKMADNSANVLILTALDEIAWLLNLRGSDIEYNPVFFAYVAITNSSVNLFVDETKLSTAVSDHFKSESLDVSFFPYDKIENHLIGFVKETQGKIWLNKGSCFLLHSLIPEARHFVDISPVCLMKAVKNEVEAQGLRNCHVRDAAALCCYFSWLEKNINLSTITEVTGADKLETLRSNQKDYMGPSFDTISSVGPNGAVIHYKPSAQTARKITVDELYLCDSGGQYRDGTTDVTRTLHFGTPTAYEKECFTRVLKGQIALATAIFPSLIKGNCLDSYPRKYLWDVGLDYQHGTSHGIGHFLNVHEGPMGISWRIYPDDPGLQEGMFLSNEPGYYEDGKFGIRLENIVQVVKASTPHNFNNRDFLTFETVTFVPIQTKMIDGSLLNPSEVRYINDYHEQCRKMVEPLLKEMNETEGLEWLQRETVPL